MAILGYEVEIDGVITDVGLPPLVNGKRQYDITGLDPEVSKAVRVRAYRSRRGNWTEEIVASTLAPFEPTQLTHLYQWFDIEELGLADNDPIATLTDLSGDSHDSTQATSGERAVYKTNQANGRAVARFDGVNDNYLLGDFSTLFTQAEAFIVIKKTADPSAALSSAGLWGFSGTDFATNFPFTGWDFINELFASTVQRNLGEPPFDLSSKFFIYHVYSAPNSFRAGINGDWLIDEVVSNTPYFWGSCFLGQDVAIPGTQFYEGDVAEFIFCGAKQSEIKRTACIEYLTDKYNIT